MADAETLMAAMQAKAGVLRRLGYRIRFDLTDLNESVLLDATGAEPEIARADEATEAATPGAAELHRRGPTHDLCPQPDGRRLPCPGPAGPDQFRPAGAPGGDARDARHRL